MGWIRRLLRVPAWATERTRGLTAEERWVRAAILGVRCGYVLGRGACINPEGHTGAHVTAAQPSRRA